MNYGVPTDLQKLLLIRLEFLKGKCQKNRTQYKLLDVEYEQFSRDMASINETLKIEARLSNQKIEVPPSNGARLLGLKLMEAIRILRDENLAISKQEIRQRLEEIGFNFKGKRPGSAVHMAWMVLDRGKNKQGDNS